MVRVARSVESRAGDTTAVRNVVNLVRRGAADSRPEIQRATGMGYTLVSHVVDRAIELGYLEDAGIGPSRGGRAPRLLRFRAEQGRILVCALGGLHIRAGIAPLVGDIEHHRDQEWEFTRGPQATLDRAFAMMDEIMENAPGAPVWGVVIGVPGSVDALTGHTMAPQISTGWNNIDVRSRFEERFGAPAWVESDVNLLALGENARRADDDGDLVYCKAGFALSAGILSRGRIHRGSTFAAGEIGHLPVPGSDAVCRCGKRGCLDAVAGGAALVERAEVAVEAGAGGALADLLHGGAAITPESIAVAAAEGDALSIALLQASARTLGEAMAKLVNVVNPRTIVVGGVLAGAGELFLGEMRQRIVERSSPLATRNLTIVHSVDDDREPLRGGAEYARRQLFDETFAQWFDDGRPGRDTASGVRQAAPTHV
jgi:predicted NBD/HSP70 family sugar kinase